MKNIGYYSNTSINFKESDIKDILETSIRKNALLGVTGLLIYANGCFFQIIEGPDKQLDDLYKDIKSDNRHQGIITLMDEKINNRSFPDWSMSVLRLDPEIFHHKEIFKLSRLALENKLPKTAPATIKIFMQSFYNSSTSKIDPWV